MYKSDKHGIISTLAYLMALVGKRRLKRGRIGIRHTQEQKPTELTITEMTQMVPAASFPRKTTNTQVNGSQMEMMREEHKLLLPVNLSVQSVKEDSPLTTGPGKTTGMNPEGAKREGERENRTPTIERDTAEDQEGKVALLKASPHSITTSKEECPKGKLNQKRVLPPSWTLW